MLCLVPYVDKEQDDASPLLFGQGCYLSLWTDDPYLNSTDEMQRMVNLLNKKDK